MLRNQKGITDTSVACAATWVVCLLSTDIFVISEITGDSFYMGTLGPLDGLGQFSSSYAVSLFSGLHQCVHYWGEPEFRFVMSCVFCNSLSEFYDVASQ